MIRFLIQRLLWAVVQVLLVGTVVFALLHLLPGDPALTILGAESNPSPEALEAVRERMGLNDPLLVQYAEWVGGLARLDLGNSLAYWVQRDDPPEMHLMRVMPTNMEGTLTRQEIIRQYSEKSGRLIENFDFYYCFGLFRLAVIAQQIYYRYYHGQTKDERFKTLIHGVRVLDKTAQAVIRSSTFPE